MCSSASKETYRRLLLCSSVWYFNCCFCRVQRLAHIFIFLFIAATTKTLASSRKPASAGNRTRARD